MAASHGIEYAIHIVTNHFGNLVAKVCGCLLRKGPLTLKSLLRYTELSKLKVKNSLLVLIQHNCVQAFVLEEDGGFEKGSKVSTQYLALLDNIFHRVRFSKILPIVSEGFGDTCKSLIHGLLEHGRLTLNQMFDRASQKQNDGSCISLDTIQEDLNKLVIAHFVERCPVSEPLLALPGTEATAKKGGAKSVKGCVQLETLEQRVMAAALPMESKRFCILINDTEENNDERKNSENPPSKSVAEKRKFDSLDSEDNCVREDKVLWRVNYEEFVCQLRHKLVIENIRAWLNNEAGIVLNSMLLASKGEEKKIKTKTSVPLSENSIYEEVIKSEIGRNMTLEHIRSLLLQLSSSCFVREVDDSYVIDFKNIIEVAQNDEIESTVLKRYGKNAYRMFRLLSMSGRLLETDEISDAAFVEKKEAASLLYRLWKDDYLLMERLVAGPTQFLLWKVNKQILLERVLDEMFHAALNLSLRLAYELDQQKEIATLPREAREGVMFDKYKKLADMRFLLESSLMKLDDAILLFHDF